MRQEPMSGIWSCIYNKECPPTPDGFGVAKEGMKLKLQKFLILAGILLVVAAVPVFWYVNHKIPEEKRLEVDFLDVGQGDAELIRTPFGQNILIDGGPDSSVLKELSKNLPWWDRRLDLVILTHPHDDHVAGLNQVLKRYDVKKAAYTGVIHNSPAFLSWLDLINKKKIPMMIIDRPQKIVLGDGCFFDVLYPLTSFLGKEVENLNNSSIVAKLVYGQTSFLFTGDAEQEEEKEILGAKYPGADVLKVGHHGSATASTEDFLAAVLPKIAVIEVGKNNDFGHPNGRTLKKLERISAQIFRTDLDGTVKMASDGKNISVIK
jgi:competence protein ComEC